MDPPDVIRRKISRAVTDSIGVVNYTDEQPGIKNLINILSAIKGYTSDEIVAMYKGKGYSEFKNDVAEAIIEELKPLQDKVNEFLKDKKSLETIYKAGADKANIKKSTKENRFNPKIIIEIRRIGAKFNALVLLFIEFIQNICNNIIWII